MIGAKTREALLLSCAQPLWAAPAAGWGPDTIFYAESVKLVGV